LLEERILNYLAIHGGVLNLRKCANEFSISEELLKEVLKAMQERGVIKLI
jgi:DNA-binding Lrp family transcriptional regulator